jgi:two-component system sensor histidine kinase EvgS
MGGTLTLSSEKNVGTTVRATFTLPKVKTAAVTDVRQHEDEDKIPALKILVDDNPANRSCWLNS